jgi:predicted TIM-barrel fold metal-dependent hydrolase
VLAVANEADVPLCLHIGSSSYVQGTAPDAPKATTYSTVYLNANYALIDWLMSENFDRFPNLKICLSEGGIGWIPHAIEMCDITWQKHGTWTDSPPKQLPSSYIRDHVYGCFIEDDFGARHIDDVGALGLDNVMVETDYPHANSTWPHSHEVIAEKLAHLSVEDQAKIMRGNAERLFKFTPSGIGKR